MDIIRRPSVSRCVRWPPLARLNRANQGVFAWPTRSCVIQLRGRLDMDRTSSIKTTLQRIRAADDSLRAFVQIAPDPTDERSTASHERPLNGLAVAVKNLIDTTSLPTEYGSRIYRDHRPTTDAAVVAELQRLGAVVVGKTTTTEFATSPPTPTRNPRRLTHTPGAHPQDPRLQLPLASCPLQLEHRHWARSSGRHHFAGPLASSRHMDGFPPMALNRSRRRSIRSECFRCPWNWSKTYTAL